MNQQPPRPGPLEGIRVVEYAVWHAGPGAGAILGDMGAEVIKIESLAGDPERGQVSLGAVKFDDGVTPGWSFLFELSNRNKKGICLDIESPKGRELFEQLVASADVFLTNLRKTTKPRLGIDYASLRRINERLVHANVSGFGPKGAMSDIGAFDPMGQAVSGMVFLAGPEEPILLQAVVLDQMTAIAASHAIVTALFVRERHGVGQEVHVSLYSAALWLTHSNLLATGMLGTNPLTGWDRARNSPLRNCFKCRDGKWLMGTNHPEDKFWAKFCDLTGQPQLKADERYATAEVRSQHYPELVALYDDVFRQQPRDTWIEKLQAAGLMFAPVQTMDEVLEDEQARANEYVVDFEHRDLGTIAIPGFPIHFSANSAGTHGPAPQLGEHSDEILEGLGLGPDDIDELRAGRIVS